MVSHVASPRHARTKRIASSPSLHWVSKRHALSIRCHQARRGVWRRQHSQGERDSGLNHLRWTQLALQMLRHTTSWARPRVRPETCLSAQRDVTARLSTEPRNQRRFRFAGTTMRGPAAAPLRRVRSRPGAQSPAEMGRRPPPPLVFAPDGQTFLYWKLNWPTSEVTGHRFAEPHVLPFPSFGARHWGTLKSQGHPGCFCTCGVRP